MIFLKRWRPSQPKKSQISLASLFKNLETAGYELKALPAASGRDGYLVLVPGLDLRLLACLGASDSWSPISQDWTSALHRCFGDRAELEIDRQSGSVRCRWVYWTPFQLLLHAAILSSAIILEPGRDVGRWLQLACLAIANFIPLALSATGAMKLNTEISASGYSTSAPGSM